MSLSMTSGDLTGWFIPFIRNVLRHGPWESMGIFPVVSIN